MKHMKMWVHVWDDFANNDCFINKLHKRAIGYTKNGHGSTNNAHGYTSNVHGSINIDKLDAFHDGEAFTQ